MKPIQKVFLVIATLVLSLLVWGFFFNDNGILERGYNAVVTPVNTTWKNISGSTDNLIQTIDVGNKGSKLDEGTNKSGTTTGN